AMLPAAASDPIVPNATHAVTNTRFMRYLRRIGPRPGIVGSRTRSSSIELEAHGDACRKWDARRGDRPSSLRTPWAAARRPATELSTDIVPRRRPNGRDPRQERWAAPVTRSTAATSSWTWNGLDRYSSAPYSRKSEMLCLRANPVSTITLMCG